MDDDYKASSGGAAGCPPGKIRRIGYTATRKGKTMRVKSACIKDRGAPGRWQTIRGYFGIGPLKKGLLKNIGYDATGSAFLRHKALDKATKRYGKNSVIRKLNAIATYTKRTVPSRAKTYRTDMHYVQKKY